MVLGPYQSDVTAQRQTFVGPDPTLVTPEHSPMVVLRLAVDPESPRQTGETLAVHPVQRGLFFG
jgi:hypothetical protein